MPSTSVELKLSRLMDDSLIAVSPNPKEITHYTHVVFSLYGWPVFSTPMLSVANPLQPPYGQGLPSVQVVVSQS
jgi:hypothetical protein